MLSASKEFKTEVKLEEKTTPSKYKRIFSTQTARDKDYPFVLDRKAFHNQKKISTPDKNTHHSVFTLIDEYKNSWHMIRNNYPNEKTIHRQLAFNVLITEIYRAEIGPDAHPAERILTDENKASPCRLSKSVKNYREFHDFFWHNLFKKEIKNSFKAKDYYENTGRIVFNKRLYQENDLKFENCWVDPINRYIGVLDPCQSFSPLTLPLLPLYEHKKCKIVNFSLQFHGQIEESRKKDIETNPAELFSQWKIKDKPFNYMGEHDEKDYHSLPKVKYFIARNWQFNVTINYSKFLKNHRPFQNEKHFSALKSQVTYQLKHELAEIHIKDDQDRQEAHDFLDKCFANTHSDIKASTSFFTYIGKNRLKAIKAILYEELQFLVASEHYFSIKPEAATAEWKLFCKQILQEYSDVLSMLGLRKLNEEEESHLLKFTDNIWRKNPESLNEVLYFYESQKMPHHQKEVWNEMIRPSKQGIFGKNIKPIRVPEVKVIEEPESKWCVIL